VVVAANELADPPPGPTKSADTVDAAEKPNAPKGQAAKLPDVGSKPGADKDTPANADTQRKGARKGKGALFRIGPEGQLEQLHALTQTYFTSVAVAPDGAIYAGAADKGRIYLIEPDDTVATAFDVDERAVAQVFWDGKRLAFTTDDTAALYRAGDKASGAKYVSEVFDAKGPSQWGRIVWQGAGKLVVETRSGNTAKPGVGWSAWAAPGKVRPPPAAAPPAAASPARPAATCSSGSACPTTARCAGSRATTCRRTPARDRRGHDRAGQQGVASRPSRRPAASRATRRSR
jgi:hypothetical protein